MHPFHLIDAYSAKEAVDLLIEHGPRAQLIASGGDLLGLIKEGVSGPGLLLPDVLINLKTVTQLNTVSMKNGYLDIGAMTTLCELQENLDTPLILKQAIAKIASPQLRTITTVGGNLLQRPRCWYFRHPQIQCFKKGAQDCPAATGPTEALPGLVREGRCIAGLPSDLATALIALDAQVEVVGREGVRVVALTDFYRGAADNPLREARIDAKELLSVIRIAPNKNYQAFVKIAPRDANEFSAVSVAAVVSAASGIVGSSMIVIGGTAPEPIVIRNPVVLTGKVLPRLPMTEVAKALLAQLIRDKKTNQLSPTANQLIKDTIEETLGQLKIS